VEGIVRRTPIALILNKLKELTAFVKPDGRTFQNAIKILTNARKTHVKTVERALIPRVASIANVSPVGSEHIARSITSVIRTVAGTEVPAHMAWMHPSAYVRQILPDSSVKMLIVVAI